MSIEVFEGLFAKTRKQCDVLLKEYATSHYLSDYPQQDFIVQENRRALLLPGKRIRPTLGYIMTQCWGKPSMPLQPFLALEILHTFLLMHDDMIDECTIRRGKDNILGKAEKHFAKSLPKGKEQHFIESIAVVGGDTAVMESLRPILDAMLSDKTKVTLINLLRKSLQETCYGWYIQFLLDYTPLAKVKQKSILDSMYWVTSRYTIALPITFALHCAGNYSRKSVKEVDEVANELGFIFQVGDDIIGLIGDPKKTGKSASKDIEQGKKTLPLFLAYHKATTVERQVMENLVGKKNLSDKEVGEFREILDRTKAIPLCQSKIAEAYEKLQNLLQSSILWKGKQAQFLLGMGEYLMQRES